MYKFPKITSALVKEQVLSFYSQSLTHGFYCRCKSISPTKFFRMFLPKYEKKLHLRTGFYLSYLKFICKVFSLKRDKSFVANCKSTKQFQFNLLSKYVLNRLWGRRVKLIYFASKFGILRVVCFAFLLSDSAVSMKFL